MGFHLQMKRSIRKCQEISLVHVVDMQEVTKMNKEVEVALDSKLFLDKFNDVFHDKIIELSPVWEVGYAIDLVANAIWFQ